MATSPPGRLPALFRRLMNGCPPAGSASKTTENVTVGWSKPSGSAYQCRSVVILAGINAVRPGDVVGVAEAVAMAGGLGLGITVWGAQAARTTTSAHTHAGYLMVMSLVPQRRWIIPRSVGTTGGDAPDGIPGLVVQILRARGLADGDMRSFLGPKLANEGPPMLDLDRAVDRIRRALAARERIVVYGDYDVDGIAGSAILVRAFRQLGVVVGAYIPNRY